MAENDDGDYRFTLMEQVFGKWAAIAKGNPPEPHEVWADVLPHKTEIDVDVTLSRRRDILSGSRLRPKFRCRHQYLANDRWDDNGVPTGGDVQLVKSGARGSLHNLGRP
jgi:hypothetical protein